MKKHILSRYSEKESKRVVQPQVTGNTLETRAAENSDPDQFFGGPTIITRSVENSDLDEFVLRAPTEGTFQKEDSDPDEFSVNTIANYYEGDFDSILLI